MSESPQNRSPSPTNLSLPRTTPTSATNYPHNRHYSPSTTRTPSPDRPQRAHSVNGLRANFTTSSSSTATSSNSASSSGGNSSRLLIKIKRFLGTLLHFGGEISPQVGERVRTLVFSLVSGHMSIEEFQQSLQEVTSFPLRPFVLPFLRAHLPLLHRDITQAARSAKQSPLSYVQTHESSFIENSSPGEPQDIFHSDPSDLSTKRKAIDSIFENGESDYAGGYTSTPKRRHMSVFSPPFLLPSANSSSSSSDYYTNYGCASNGGHLPATTTTPTPTTSGGQGGEEEWKNIHTMLNCILSMVEKTKRALGMLQSRAQQQHQDPWLRRPGGGGGGGCATDTSEELRRQVAEMMAQAVRSTEDRVAEVKRKAEEAVQEVKRQALQDLQRALTAAETRACDAVATERARLERLLMDSSRRHEVSGILPPPPPHTTETEACWNCGRKAQETCSGCNIARYCSSFCQHKDWEGHHSVCGRERSTHPHNHTPNNNNSISEPRVEGRSSPVLNVGSSSPSTSNSPRSVINGPQL